MLICPITGDDNFDHLLEVISARYTRDSIHFCVIHVADIFSLFVSCPLTLFVVLFCHAKVFILFCFDKVKFIYYYNWILSHNWESFTYTSVKEEFTCVLLENL